MPAGLWWAHRDMERQADSSAGAAKAATPRALLSSRSLVPFLTRARSRAAAEGKRKKRLHEMTSDDVVEWVERHYPDLLEKKEFLVDEAPSGRTLSKLTLQGFIRAFGPLIGEAFYNSLVEDGAPLHVLRFFFKTLGAFSPLACFRLSSALLCPFASQLPLDRSFVEYTWLEYWLAVFPRPLMPPFGFPFMALVYPLFPFTLGTALH